jgi:hypothetical protein
MGRCWAGRSCDGAARRHNFVVLAEQEHVRSADLRDRKSTALQSRVEECWFRAERISSGLKSFARQPIRERMPVIVWMKSGGHRVVADADGADTDGFFIWIWFTAADPGGGATRHAVLTLRVADVATVEIEKDGKITQIIPAISLQVFRAVRRWVSTRRPVTNEWPRDQTWYCPERGTIRRKTGARLRGSRPGLRVPPIHRRESNRVWHSNSSLRPVGSEDDEWVTRSCRHASRWNGRSPWSQACRLT